MLVQLRSREPLQSSLPRIAVALICLTCPALALTGGDVLTGPVQILWDEDWIDTPAPGDRALTLVLDDAADVLYAVSDYDGTNRGIHARAMRASTGEVIWQAAYPDPGFQVDQGADTFARLTPDGSRLYVSIVGYVFDYITLSYTSHDIQGVLDAQTGALLWSKQDNGDNGTLGISPDSQTVYQWAGDFIVALDLATGNPLWSSAALSPGLSDQSSIAWMHVPPSGSPLLLGGIHRRTTTIGFPGSPPLIESFPMTLAISASDGTLLWEEHYDSGAPPLVPETQGYGSHASLAPDGTVLYTAGRLFPPPPLPFTPPPPFTVKTPYVRAYTPDTGTELWTSLISVAVDSHVIATAIAPCGSALYVLVRPTYAYQIPGLTSTLYALDRVDGSELWSRDLAVGDPAQIETLSDFSSSADGRVLVATFRAQLSPDFFTVAISAASGEELWEAESSGSLYGTFSYATEVSADGRTAYVGGRSPTGFPAQTNTRIRAYHTVDPSLRADTDTLSLVAGGTQTLTLDAGACLGGSLYLLVGSLSGTSPGIPLPGGLLLPLNPDAYFSFTLQHPNSPPLAASFGFLGGDGSASATFGLPPGAAPQLSGLHFEHAYAALDPTSGLLLHTSPAVGLDLVP